MSFYKLKDNQKQFLKKIKEQEQEAQKRRKQEQSAVRLTAVIRKFLSNRRHISPIIKQAEQKIQAIVIKKKEIDPQKFNRMMSNAVQKMPIIMAPLSLVSFQSLPTYSDYVLRLVTALTVQGSENPIIKKILEAKDVRTIQFLKLAEFAIKLAGTDIVYQEFLKQFITQSTGGQYSFDPLSKIINSDTLPSLKRLIINAELDQKYQQLFTNEILIKYLPLFQKNLAPIDIFNMILTSQTITAQAIQKLSWLLNQNNHLPFAIKEFIRQRSINELKVLYKQSTQLIRRLSANISFALLKGFQIHNAILSAYYNAIFSTINNKLYGKKMMVEDKDELNERNERVRRTEEYRSFLTNVDLQLYFGPILEIFKQILQHHSQQSILYSLCELYLLLQELFRKTHSRIFNRLTNIELLSSFYQQVCKLDSTQIDFSKRSKEMAQLQLFITMTLHKFSELDDVQFANPAISFNKNTLEQIIRMLLKLVMLLAKTSINNSLFQYASLLLNDLYKKVFRTKFINLKIFESENLDQLLENLGTKKKENNVQLLLKTIPFGFSFQARLVKLRELIKNDKKNFNRNLGFDEEYDNDHTVQIRRGYEFNDAFQQLASRQMRQKYRIVYINQQGIEEEGVDGGGIIKQLINEIIKVAFNPIYGLFRETAAKQIIPNPNLNAQNMRLQLQFIGKLVGKAIYQNILIQPKFAGPFLNIMIGKENSFEDLQFLDKTLYKSLLDIKHTKEDITFSELTFSFDETDAQGKIKTIQLKQNGRNILVTDQNKLQFVMAYADYKVNREFFQQGRLFRKGFTQIIQEEWLEMFNYQELNLMVSGNSSHFNIFDLMENTVYTGYEPKDLTIRYFWEVLNQMTMQEKALFLHYVTSCSRPPTLGFKELKPKFCIKRSAAGADHLPTVHTCMNLLGLPNYANKEILKEKLMYAIHAKAGFDVT